MIDILIPTLDNRVHLEPCLRSIRQWTRDVAYRILVINNGPDFTLDWVKHYGAEVWEGHGNHGWTGGLHWGLQATDSPLVLFLNDDTIIPPSSGHWLLDLGWALADKRVGAAGPCTNEAIGVQNIRWGGAGIRVEVDYLVGFCMLVSREALERAGGVDPSLYGGDDIDLSIRLRKAGYKLVAHRGVYVHHTAYTTGNRVYGPAHLPGGWNSTEYVHRTLEALHAKHGIEVVQDTFRNQHLPAVLVPADDTPVAVQG